MKQLKDYLHLYLGCEGQLTKKRSYGSPKRTTETLTTALLNSIDQISSIYSFKPILRPLSDMTAMEILEIGRISISDVRACYTVDQFQKLLSKHFDLFGLIEAGLAIDKTTLNNA